jgi:hypothetical protein
MATDIKTTAERVRVLKVLSKELLNIARSCESVQDYHDNATDYVSRNENVNSSMASIKSAIDAVAAALTDMASTANMEFQFEWVAGRGHIGSISVSSSAQTVLLIDKAGEAIRSGYVNALVAGDIISFGNSTYTTSPLSVFSMANSTTAYVNGLGGTESLLSRVVKELKG